MKKTFLMTLAAAAIFAVSCEKDEINDLQNQVNVNKSQQVAGDNTVAAEAAAALASAEARLEEIDELNKRAQEEGDEAIKDLLDDAIEALNATIIAETQESRDQAQAALDSAVEALTKLINEEATKLQDNLDAAAEALEAADEDLQSSIAEAQANLDAAVKELEAADESNLSAALDAVAVARAAAQAAIDAVELEGGNDGLSEEEINVLIKAAVDAIPDADLTDLTDRLQVLEDVEVPAGFDDTDLKKLISDLQDQVDGLVIQSVDDINALIKAAVDAIPDADYSSIQTQIDAINVKINDLPDAFDDTDLQNQIDDLQSQITELAGVDFYTYTPYTPEFVDQTSDFTQTRTASLTIIGSKDSQAPVAIVSRSVKVVAGTPSDEPVLSADVPTDSLHADDDLDGLNKYVKTSTIYTATSGVDAVGTHTVVSYGSFENADAPIVPVDPTDIFVPGAYGPAFTNQIVNFEQSRTGTVSVVGDEDAIAPTDDAPTRTITVSAGNPSTETVSSSLVPADQLNSDDDGDGLNTYVKTSTVYTASNDLGTHTVVSYGSYTDVDEAVTPPAAWTESGGVYSHPDYIGSFTIIDDFFSGQTAVLSGTPITPASTFADPTNAASPYYDASMSSNSVEDAIAIGKRAIISLQN